MSMLTVAEGYGHYCHNVHHGVMLRKLFDATQAYGASGITITLLGLVAVTIYLYHTCMDEKYHAESIV